MRICVYRVILNAFYSHLLTAISRARRVCITFSGILSPGSLCAHRVLTTEAFHVPAFHAQNSRRVCPLLVKSDVELRQKHYRSRARNKRETTRRHRRRRRRVYVYKLFCMQPVDENGKEKLTSSLTFAIFPRSSVLPFKNHLLYLLFFLKTLPLPRFSFLFSFFIIQVIDFL